VQDPRSDLKRLPTEQLFAVARNSAAVHRLLAIEILTLRSSPFAGHPEIADEARRFVLNRPAILKELNPAAAAFATNLPGLVDCVQDGHEKHIELARVVNEHHAANAEDHVAHTQMTAPLEATVNDNKAAHKQALREAHSTLWRDYTRKIFQIKLDHDTQFVELREEHEKDITSASERLRLLERSAWQKLVDYLKKRNWIARHKLPRSSKVLSGFRLCRTGLDSRGFQSLVGCLDEQDQTRNPHQTPSSQHQHLQHVTKVHLSRRARRIASVMAR
jgi:hypothetical protein